MAENFYTILTNTGKAKLANAQALGTTVQFSSIAVGDGSGNYYDPTESQTALKNEVWRGAINQIKTDSENPNWIIVEVVIPTTTGGFTVREAGIIDSEGDLIALGKYPATYKPALAEGSGKDLYIRMILEVSNASTIMLKIDPAIVLSTRGYVDDSIAEHNTDPLAHGNLPYQKTSQKDQPGGYAGLDSGGLLPSAKLNPDVYTMGNVLGTVSQLEGVPTGAIIERGSNANGEYVRFADGTQVCTGRGTWTTEAVSHKNFTPTMPASFPSIGHIKWGDLVLLSAPGKLFICGAFSPNGDFTIYTANESILSTGISTTYYWIIVGRWY
jgi:hypothetical protein